MYNSSMLNRVASDTDYLVIGHITRDLLPGGEAAWGGTAAYAGLTAHRLGRRAAALTVFNPAEDLGPLADLPIAGASAEQSTTFENIENEHGRAQRVHHIAGRIHPYMLPESWRTSPIVHFAPVLDEMDLDLLRLFSGAFRLVTPQGWMRTLDKSGFIRPSEWIEAEYFLGQVDAAIISQEDAGGDERLIDRYAAASRLLVVTCGPAGCRVFHEGQEHRIAGESAEAVDTTGAGDIFAAGFAIHMQRTGDPIDGARFGAHLAAISVTRRNLLGVPTETECMEALTTFKPEMSF